MVPGVEVVSARALAMADSSFERRASKTLKVRTESSMEGVLLGAGVDDG